MIGIRTAIAGSMGGGQSWASYWASLISVTVENAAPTNVVLTFPTAKPELTDTDFTIAGFTISSASWAGAVLTLVLDKVVYEDDILVVTFVTTGGTTNVTNNVIAPQIGIILNDLFDSISADWNLSQIGAGGSFTATGGEAVYVRAGSGNFDSEVFYTGLGKTLLENWEIEIILKGTSTSISLGVGPGIRSDPAKGNYNIFGGSNSGDGSTGRMYIWNLQTNNYLGDSLGKYTTNDRIKIRFVRAKNVFTVYGENITDGTSGNVTHTFGFDDSVETMCSIGYPQLQSMGGTWNIEYFKWSSVDYKNINFALVGDSITQGYEVTAIANRFADKIIAASSKKGIILAAGRTAIADIYNDIAELIRINPRRVIIMLGANDVISGFNEATIETQYAALINGIVAAGITPIICTIPPITGKDVRTFNTFLKTTYSGIYTVIDVYAALVGVAPDWDAAYVATGGVHPNDAGHTIIYNTIVAAVPDLL